MCKLFNRYENEIENYCKANQLDFEIVKGFLNVGVRMIFGCSIMIPIKEKTD